MAADRPAQRRTPWRRSARPAMPACRWQTRSRLAAFATSRRLEVIGEVRDGIIYDDFAHHPSASATLRRCARASAGASSCSEPRSHTMRLGVHRDTLVSLAAADRVVIPPPDLAGTWAGWRRFDRQGVLPIRSTPWSTRSPPNFRPAIGLDHEQRRLRRPHGRLLARLAKSPSLAWG